MSARISVFRLSLSGAAVLAMLATPRIGAANFLSLPLDLIQATEFGLPLANDDEIPELNVSDQPRWWRLPAPAGGHSVPPPPITGHSSDFTDSLVGAGPQFNRGGAAGSGLGGWASQGVGPGPGIGDPFLTTLAVLPGTTGRSDGTGDGSGSGGGAGSGGGSGSGGGGAGGGGSSGGGGGGGDPGGGGGGTGGGGGGGGGGGDGPDVSAVPEPGTVTLLGIGLISLVGWQWKRKRVVTAASKA